MFDSKNKMKVIDFGFGKEIDKDLIKKYGTQRPNMKFMVLGFILKMKGLGVDVNKEYSHLKSHIDVEELKKCSIYK